MSFQIVIAESVYVELNEAALYYELHQSNLGMKFVLDWEATMLRLKETPLLFQKKHKQFRSIQLNHFPYHLIYEVENSKVFVYCLKHAKQNPKNSFKKG